jgi:hypothetical protein
MNLGKRGPIIRFPLNREVVKTKSPVSGLEIIV